ncbi:hypothetical protein [Psychroserpens mesophilus]|uniref:hypothetical protein n=1 Tax=Psychroserpens mesophilus TaxID=325473 RepID=UPI00058F02B0|nr:hypothetical protein [Psychroserpens mesophilus]
MPYKLSLIREQQINDHGWNQYDGNPYNANTIKEITDNIGKMEVPVTSIPSPFAQMHLFETSFEFINKAFEESNKDKTSLEGKTTYHKNVSRCLDIFEMLFRFETLKLKDRISVKIWHVDELKKVAKDHNLGIKTFAETLQIFIGNYNSDKRFKNQGILNAFSDFTLIYLNNVIIAGTSPYTGFFTIGEALPQTILNEDNRAFFSNNLPLYKRKGDFQKYMNVLFFKEPNLVESFKEVYAYMQHSNKISEISGLRHFVGSLSSEDQNQLTQGYTILEVSNTEITFLNGKVPFLCEKYNKQEDEIIAKNSDYVIVTSKQLRRPPLALSINGVKSRWNYLDGNSFPKDGKTTSTKIIEKRKLPQSVIEYPWINRNDFLSKHLIQLDYNVNTSKFWLPGGEVKNIILPIATAYFDYFTIDDLKKHITVEKLNLGAIVVTLKIPIKADNGRGTIKFERIYDYVVPETIDNDENGAVIKSSLAFGIYPFFKVSDPVFNDRYKALSYHMKGEEINYNFLRELITEPNTTKVEATEISRTRKDENYPSVSNYLDISSIKYNSQGEVTYCIDKDITFDLVSVAVTNLDKNISLHGILLPLMGEQIQLSDGTSSIAFDIGTSNSFVAFKTVNTVENLSTYKGKGTTINPDFVLLNEVSKDGEQYKKYDLNKIKPIYGAVQDAEFLPSVIGDESPFKFPIRSIINIDNDTKPEQPGNINILSNANIPFAFGHSSLRYEYDFTHSNIKWGVTDSNNNSAQNKLHGFIEQLAWMGRNKLLSEGYNPRATNVIWFKPLSMSTNQMTVFNSIWQELFATYYSKSENYKNLVSVTESWAPYYSYPNDFGSGKVFMNLDIGGGTTDLIVFENEKPTLTTSFRFAGNSLFESRNSNKPFDNGFVTRYETAMLKYFGEDLKKKETVKYIKNSNGLQSTDLLSYFFNYKEFGKKLAMDSEFKLLFLIHNSAIFYHSCQMLKMIYCKDLPTYIGLSGNGAKLMEVTNGTSDLNRRNGISKLGSLILKQVFSLDKLHQIEIQILKNPKESTAIGGIDGLKNIKDKSEADIENYYISVGTENDLIKNNDAIQKQAFKYVNFLQEENSTIDNVTDNVVGFFTYFFEKLWFEADFVQNFGVDKAYNTNKLKNFFTDRTKISDTIRQTVHHKVNIEKETPLNDTLFFEAIKAYLYAFSKYIVTDKINQYKGA